MSTTRHQSILSPGTGQQADAPKVHVVTFGCQMNKYDSELVEGRFRRDGYVTTDRAQDADVLLFNTCSVRDHAEERTWSWVGELKRVKEQRPELVIGVMGCMAQRVEDEVFKRAGHVDLVAGTRQFQDLPRMVAEVRARRANPLMGSRATRVLATDASAHVRVDRTGEPYRGGAQAFLAVMRGCDLSCTYCIVPTTRGRVQSRSIEEIVDEARWMVDGGAQVITLLGQTVNSYGEDFPRPTGGARRWSGRQGRPSLADLLRRLQEVDGLVRLRLITLHPSYVTPAFAAAVRDCDKVDRFLPLPAQAGSDELLRRMKRGYNLDLYRRRADTLREVVPEIELGSDWIVGFSGETEDEFRGSEEFLVEQQFLVNYIFKYDPRPGTSADRRMSDDVPEPVKKERNARLLAVAERVQRARFRRSLGERVSAYVERASDREQGLLLARSSAGMPVSFEGPANLIGTTQVVEVGGATAFGMSGALC